MVRSDLAENIKLLRKSKGWTQLQLAEESGLGVNAIKRIEIGMTGGWTATRESIAKALGCTMAELYGKKTAEKQTDLFRQVVATLIEFDDKELSLALSNLQALRSASLRPKHKQELR